MTDTHAFLGRPGQTCSAQTINGLCGEFQLAAVHDLHTAVTEALHAETTAKLLEMAEGPYPAGRVYGTPAGDDETLVVREEERAYQQVGTPWAAEVAAEEEIVGHMSPVEDHNLFRCPHPDCVKDAHAARARAGVVLDVPAEDGGSGSGSWAFAPSAARLRAEEPETVNEEETLAAASARFLREGSLMTWGPWPVRQYPADGDVAARQHLRQLLDGLLTVGEPWFAECWWMNSRTRVVRVQWGQFLSATAAEVETAVAAWTE